MNIGTKVSIAILAISALLTLAGCSQPASTSDIATAVQNKLATTGPTWSGSTWVTNAAEVISETITKNVTVYQTSSSATTTTPITLQSAPATVVLNANGTFTLTQTTTNNANAGNNYIPDFCNWSTSTTAFLPPAPLASGTVTSYYGNSSNQTIIYFNGNFYIVYPSGSSYYLVSSSTGSTYTPVIGSSGDCTIGTTSNSTMATAYGVPSLYPVTWNAASVGGKVTAVTTESGTWTTQASSSGLYTGQDAVLSVTSWVTVTNTYNSTGTLSSSNTTTNNIPSAYRRMPFGGDQGNLSISTNPDTNKSTFMITYNEEGEDGSTYFYQQ
jgi:hypothetical protein